MTGPIRPGPEGIAWLERILKARLGGNVKLEHTGDAWILRMTDDEGAVRFPHLFGGLEAGVPPELCCHVKAPEGLVGLNDLVAPGLAAAPGKLVTHEAGGTAFSYDVPGLVFWALTRLEEIGRDDVLDTHGRFPASASHAVRFGYLERPIVDEWIMALAFELRELWPGLSAQFDAQPGLALSHDVDTPSRYGFTSVPQLARRMAGDMRRGVPLRDVTRAPLMRREAWRELPKRDPSNSFDWIMDQSEKAGVASTFYFITHPHPHPEDPRYPFDSPAIHDLLQRIHARGHDIGLHPSYGSFRHPERIADEAQRLVSVCNRLGIQLSEPGGRMHYLQWQAATTPSVLATAGLRHDATLGYADRPGFRAGTCHPYPWFDAMNDRLVDIEMRPLIVMEQSLISQSYLALEPEDALDAALSLKAAADRVGGTFSVLWHNDVLSKSTLRALYAEIIGNAR